jgi:glutaredoxin 3
MEEKKPNVRVFSTSSCPYCVTLKAYLEEHNIAYEDLNVGEDQAARQEMIDRTQQMGVPVVEIDGQIVIGFDKERINQLLKIHD